MRRVLAIAIVLILGLPAVTPLLGLSGGGPGLPACCRRDGKHHCMAGMAAATTSSKTQAAPATVTERCPYGAHSLPGDPHSGAALDTSAAIYAGVLSHPSIAPQSESKRRISADRSRQKRGPPSCSLA